MPKLTLWRLVAVVILASSAVAAWLRFTQGLGATTHLSDGFPWGLWIGFDVLCGVGLAAGGFTIVAVVHVFNARRFEPIVRPAILTAFLGYLLVIAALLIDLGRPLRAWHPLVMWNPRSVMFEVVWCVILYTLVLALEFAPAVFERLRARRALRVLRATALPVVVAGVILSTLHQSSLGALFLIVPGKLHPLWYTPLLPVLFFVSAVAAGCAMIIFESCMSCRAFRRGLELDLLGGIARGMAIVLAVYLALRGVDLVQRGAAGLPFVAGPEAVFFWAEVLVGAIVPMLLLSSGRVRRDRRGLFLSAVMVVIGFVLSRMNVTLTGFQASAGTTYFPSWIEISVTLGIVTMGIVAFALAARHLPVFTSGEARGEAGASQGLAQGAQAATQEI
jgi:Ni/Fe-hydrogenase subunit HybB-like protein